jgi:tetratricopeptide (TPR) repeat protein
MNARMSGYGLLLILLTPLCLLHSPDMEALVVIPEAEAAYREATHHSTQDQPEAALEAAQRALDLDPQNVRYLLGHAQIANWLGKYELALRSYEGVLALTPKNREALLGRARSAAWAGQLAAATRYYRDYVARYPDDEQARLEYARVASWQGDFAGAVGILNGFQEAFDPSRSSWRDYLVDRARILTAADRPTPALEILAPLLREEPENPALIGIETLALHGSGRPAAALEGVEVLRDLAPGAPKTVEIERIVTTPRRAVFTPHLAIYSDSDSVERAVAGFDGGFSPTAASRLKVGVWGDELDADPGSGLDSSDGDTVRSAELWLAYGGRPTPKIWLEGRLGDAEIDGGGDLLTYRALARFDLNDEVQVTLQSQRGFYAVSPKALEREIYNTTYRAGLHWTPDFRYTVELSGGVDDFSDGNRYWEAVLAPRRAVVRRQGFNLDLGLRAWWFGFDDNPGNGYYAPEEYERYTFTTFSYWKITDNTGVSLVAGAGYFKDSTMDDFEFGGDAALEVTVGLYRDWLLLLRGSYTENTRQASGAFDAWGGAVYLSRRF